LAGAGGETVLVPGGGPFADVVRTVQMHSGISDSAAHHMAILAMEQYGLMLCDLSPGLLPADSLENIGHALRQGLTPVWMPVAMCRHAAELPQNWSVTSDSLAAWLATQLSADNLTLVKYGQPADADPLAMAASGWVDQAFPAFAQAFGGSLRVLDFHAASTMSAWLTEPA
jgi:dihydroneopterin aldolase